MTEPVDPDLFPHDEVLTGNVSETAPTEKTASVYSRPTLRVCERIAPEARDGLVVGLDKRFAGLTGGLPLLGGQVLAPISDGQVRLCASLRSTMPWMEDAIRPLERQLRIAAWAGRPWLAWRPICLVGEPGGGKSHLAREIGRLAGVGHAALDLAGMHDAAALVATSRGWTNTKPCWPAEMMNSLGCANPVLVLDELEKAGGSRRNGDPH